MDADVEMVLLPGMSAGNVDETDSIESWFETSSSSPSEYSKQAYESAKIYFLEHLGADGTARVLIEQNHSILDVLRVVNDARKRYHVKRNSKASKWLARVSEKVAHYGTVLDVFVQHHPEYVSLVWGTFKLLFSVKELAKTCTQIANILDRAEITLRLYSSERLMGAVSELYVNILEFLKHAVKWYAKGRLGRAWTAIARPWELGFRDYVLEIKAVSKRIEGVAEVASQAELRATRLETKQVREELALTKLQLERLLPMMEQIYSLQNQLQVDYSSSMGAIQRVEHNQILSLPIMAHLPTPGQAMNYCRSIRNRRRQRYHLAAPTVRQFEDWSRGAASSFIFTSAANGQISRDFLVDSVEMIKSSQRSVVWVMRYENYWEKPLTSIDLLKVLVLQCLQINPRVLRTSPFPPTVASFLDAVDEHDWLSILNRTVMGLPMLYVVLDADVVNAAVNRDKIAATRLLESFTRIASSTSVKVVVERTAVDRNYIRRAWNDRTWSDARIDGGDGKRGPSTNFFVQRRTQRRRRR
ncbi:hypothetical protein TruAng_010060 [Truncatella angustata]|nr:hypothetical protein TruAng_010060 [Truncatella angustata]